MTTQIPIPSDLGNGRQKTLLCSIYRWAGQLPRNRGYKGNKHSTTVIVAAITGKEHAKPNLPTHVIVNDCEYLEKDSIILLEQIRTLDKQRLQEYIGTFDRRFMMSVNKALAISIGISKKD